VTQHTRNAGTGTGEVGSKGKSLAQLSMEFAEAVRARSNPAKGLPADKEFIDSLYEEEDGDGNFALTDIELA
jgi:hypothetical protein